MESLPVCSNLPPQALLQCLWSCLISQYVHATSHNLGRLCLLFLSKHQCPSIYQPISLLPVLIKVLERHFHTLIISTQLAKNCLLSNFHWGFQSGKSTETAVLATTYEWFGAGKDICAVFFDLKKAFDSVSHHTLMAKLHSLDLDPYILHLLCSYLTENRRLS